MASEKDEKVLENDTEKWEKKAHIEEKVGFAKPGDVLDKVYIFIDENLRIIRSIPWVLGAVGVLIIARRTHAFTIFRHNSEVPREYLTKSMQLRGRVVSVCEDNSLKVQHLPVLWRSRVKPVSGSDSENCLDLSLCGVKCQKGGTEWLNKNVLSHEIIFSAFGHDNCMLLESAVYKKVRQRQCQMMTTMESSRPMRQFLPFQRLLGKVCVNEVLIKEGLATVRDIQSLQHSRKGIEFTQQLLAAELYAQKKGRGIWKRPSWIERWRSLPPAKVMLKSSVRTIFDSLQDIFRFRRRTDQ